jgi:hypothetical protein
MTSVLRFLPSIELLVLLYLGAHRKQNTPLTFSLSSLTCPLSREHVLIPGQSIRCVGNVLNEALPSTGVFRLSGFLTNSSRKHAWTWQQSCVSKPLPRNGRQLPIYRSCFRPSCHSIRKSIVVDCVISLKAGIARGTVERNKSISRGQNGIDSTCKWNAQQLVYLCSALYIVLRRILNNIRSTCLTTSHPPRGLAHRWRSWLVLGGSRETQSAAVTSLELVRYVYRYLSLTCGTSWRHFTFLACHAFPYNQSCSFHLLETKNCVDMTFCNSLFLASNQGRRRFIFGLTHYVAGSKFLEIYGWVWSDWNAQPEGSRHNIFRGYRQGIYHCRYAMSCLTCISASFCIVHFFGSVNLIDVTWSYSSWYIIMYLPVAVPT